MTNDTKDLMNGQAALAMDGRVGRNP